jgi:small subunit ribosomal protein S6
MATKKAAAAAAAAKPADPELVGSQYEAMFLLGASATADLEGGISLCRSMIERHAGKVLVIKKWDERKLAYEVSGQKRGTYVIAYFTAPGEAVGPIERDVKLNEQVLRVMITKADHLSETEMAAVEPQPIQPREERNPWDRPSWDRPRDDRGPRDDRQRDDRPRDEHPPREDRPREDRPAAAAERAPRAPRKDAAPVAKE